MSQTVGLFVQSVLECKLKEMFPSIHPERLKKIAGVCFCFICIESYADAYLEDLAALGVTEPEMIARLRRCQLDLIAAVSRYRSGIIAGNLGYDDIDWKC